MLGQKINDVSNIERFLTPLCKNGMQFHVSRRADRDSTEIILVARTEVSQYEIVKNGTKVVFDKVQDLKDNLMSSDLFYSELKALEEYKKLSNMKFVLDALKELDLSSIKEQKQEPEYVDISLMLGGKSGKAR